ncbi:MAG: flippase-like domain-containing protein [Candidatus Omnitrophica bacterium]|nr:flippase-like domain-containing protein [Candidatus Omnitrophota bacterium]MCF7877379.1 flippase-like domain-containing protein [Candidatus Omnitrophota bacterium]MCF7878835.1 flippase-like domain-containing protein [Candidatus Omnitrophota bacterium]MCF7893102.1 flippase-like domain-containing protein [Candidatus Omnitrophota bacterium]
MRKKIFFFLRIIITIAIFFVLFKFIPYQRLICVYKNSQKTYLSFAFIIFWFSLFLGIVRWKILLTSVGAAVSFRETFYSYLSGLFLNLFFPSFVAGDLFRGFGISQRHGKANKIASTVLMDRFSGGIALTAVALVSFLFLDDWAQKRQVLLPIFILVIIVIFLSFTIFSRSFFNFLLKIFKKGSLLRSKLSLFHDQLYFFKKNSLVFYKSLLLSLLIQILIPIGFFIASLAFALTLSPIIFLVLIPIIMAAAFIPITIAGAGTREALLVYFLSGYGVAESIGLGISLVNLFFLISASLLGGIFYVTVYHRWLQSSS